MLGDPELRLWSGFPRTLAVTQPGSMALDDTTLAVHVETEGAPLYGARVTAYKAGDEYVSLTTDGAGNVILPVRPDSIGTMKLTVTAYDCRPYQADVAILAAAQSVLATLAPVVSDNPAPPSAGNQNEIVDAGEVVLLMVPVVNRGGSVSTGVVGTLTTADPDVLILDPSSDYGTIAPSATATGSGFLVEFPLTIEDQREIPFRVDLVDAQSRHFVENFQVNVHAAELHHIRHSVVDLPGNQNGVIEPGETIHYTVRLKNLGTGVAQEVTARLRAPDGGALVADSTAGMADLDPGVETSGDEFVFSVDSVGVKLQLEVYDVFGSLWKQTVDVVRPSIPQELLGLGGATSIKLSWARVMSPDLQGYNVYRSLSQGGPFARVNPNPTGRIAYYLDTGLAALTRYYYYVTAVDSSGNESAASGIGSFSTNPPMHAGWPIPMGQTTPSSVVMANLYPEVGGTEVIAGSDVLYFWHVDGSYPVDGDGTTRTSGDFTTRGKYYAAGPSVGDLDGDGWAEIVAPSWDSLKVYAFSRDGAVKPGFPAHVGKSVWSSAALGDLDNDGTLEMVMGSNDRQVFALRHDGTEWIDGDSSPGTFGVFKVMVDPFNYGTPALGDIDGNGQLDIVYGSFDLGGGTAGKLYVWRPDGSDLPGFPIPLGTSITSSAALGDLDNDGDLEIVITSARDSIYAYRNDGTLMPGWPQRIKASGVSRSPSPALADVNGDGFLDVVINTTDGYLRVFDRNGNLLPGWSNVRYSLFFNGASESSPVVADITGDGLPDVVVGGEDGRVHLFNSDGVELAGSPIQLAGEVRGTPGLCDCDGDGLSEIVLAGWDKNLYIWDYPGEFSPAEVAPWPMFHHDERRTGRKSAPVFAVGVETPSDAVPVEGISLSRPMPNPAFSGTRFSFAISAAAAGERMNLAVYDLSGRRVATLIDGPAKAGRHEAVWNLHGNDGGRAQSGVYFALLRVGRLEQSSKIVVVR
jgi:uncharacterized repeat protein (TIGR01451 family)